ncbi:MAG: hypothetical protein ACOCX2_07570 [Armatimonadota bacterium]
MIERLDADGDGRVSIDELPERLRERFAEADANGDGILSVEELQQSRRRGSPGGRADRQAEAQVNLNERSQALIQ